MTVALIVHWGGLSTILTFINSHHFWPRNFEKVEKQFTRALTLEANLSTKPGLPQARGSKRNDILVVLKVNVQDLIVIIIIRSRLTEQYVPIDL